MGRAAKLKQQRRSTFQRRYDEAIASPCNSADGVRVKTHVYKSLLTGFFVVTLETPVAQDQGLTCWNTFERAIGGAQEARALIPRFNAVDIVPACAELLEALSEDDEMQTNHLTARLDGVWLHLWQDSLGNELKPPQPCNPREVAMLQGTIPRCELVALER